MEADVWNYRIVRRQLNDGAIYGMHEAYYSESLALQGWTEAPYWTEQDQGDFALTIDRMEHEYKRDGTRPEWARFDDESDFLPTLKYMRQACSKGIIDEDKEMGKWDD